MENWSRCYQRHSPWMIGVCGGAWGGEGGCECPQLLAPSRLKSLVNQSEVMVFMKGSPDVRQ